jgi:hypothetical protein
MMMIHFRFATCAGLVETENNNNSRYKHSRNKTWIRLKKGKEGKALKRNYVYGGIQEVLVKENLVASLPVFGIETCFYPSIVPCRNATRATTPNNATLLDATYQSPWR